ncbi:uncharacterized protein LOC117178737 [Belonocnema kinseyi]|uniref:uncharacterized protein LOC117178737 n=1 Tax=Belonocnema kinseyi TaxID=2817044 RepID=UPI00143CC65E|nr:uncharacterized protein LOC117178737 [Belonocnema kinseyi]
MHYIHIADHRDGSQNSDDSVTTNISDLEMQASILQSSRESLTCLRDNIDNLSKYCIGVAIPNVDAATIAQELAMNLHSVYGAPRCILTDQGKTFVSKLMRKLSKIFQIKQVTTSGYRPQTNGALARSHAVPEAYIRQYVGDYDDWDRLLPYALFIQLADKVKPAHLSLGGPLLVSEEGFLVNPQGYHQVFPDGSSLRTSKDGLKEGVGVWFNHGPTLYVSKREKNR